jgi:hypothetical protein
MTGSANPESPDSGVVLAHHPGMTSHRYEVFIVWMPHSVLARPRQRPARASSSGEVRLVQGMHPTDR